jgi:rhodanese-related sulfurtransferase
MEKKMFKKLFGKKEKKELNWGFGTERLSPMREDFPDENFLNEGRIVIDIRDEDSIKDLGYYEGSIFLSVDENFVEQVKKLNKPVYVLCEKGVESYEATKLLRENGIDAQNLNGGFYYIREVINIKPVKVD